MHDPISDFPSRIQEEFNQRLRLRRFLMASTFSVLYLLVLIVFYTQGKIDHETLFEACAIVGTAISVFFGLFRLGVNRRFPDPSLTVIQFLSAIFTMLFVVYRAPDTRLAFTGFFFVALMFGMLRFTSRKLAVLGVISLASFGLVTWVRYTSNHDADILRLDMLQLFVMAMTFPWLVFIGGRVKRLQRDLIDVSIKLEDIEEKSRHDDLTGVYNRRALTVAMEESRRRAHATGEPLSVCVIDLDFFKRYNDEFDHSTGDEVLRTFAQAVRGGLRSTDIFGRYGGEEFVQMMPNTSLAGAMLDAERLRSRISTLDIPVARSIGPLTVSIGVAQYRPGETIAQTFARADGALYKAKLLGRNRVQSS